MTKRKTGLSVEFDLNLSLAGALYSEPLIPLYLLFNIRRIDKYKKMVDKYIRTRYSKEYFDNMIQEIYEGKSQEISPVNPNNSILHNSILLSEMEKAFREGRLEFASNEDIKNEKQEA